MIPKRSRARRQAFTLMELLIVIAIIGVLAALILAAIGALGSKTTEVANRNDVLQLSAAIQNFKNKFGFYPPCRIKLCVYLNDYDLTQTLDQESVRIITTMFKNIDWKKNLPVTAGTPMRWNGNGATFLPSTTVGNNNKPAANGVILEGDQCLVFFLGGIPLPVGGGNAIPGCQGFSPDPKNPTNFNLPAKGGQTPDTIGPYFKFESSRLTPRLTADQFRLYISSANTLGTAPWGCALPGPVPSGGHTAATYLFYSYLDGYLKKPYLYFSSGGRKNGYNLNDCIWTGNWAGSMNGAGAASGDQYLVGPVYSNATTPAGGNTQYQYPNSDSFQILCAGSDAVYGQGIGGLIQNNQPNTWAPASASSYEAVRQQLDTVTNPSLPGGNGQDDIANFYDSQLKVPQ